MTNRGLWDLRGEGVYVVFVARVARHKHHNSPPTTAAPRNPQIASVRDKRIKLFEDIAFQNARHGVIPLQKFRPIGNTVRICTERIGVNDRKEETRSYYVCVSNYKVYTRSCFLDELNLFHIN
jgi:hypothetical protein